MKAKIENEPCSGFYGCGFNYLVNRENDSKKEGMGQNDDSKRNSLPTIREDIYASSDPKIEIFPVPAKNDFNITSEEEIEKITLFD